MNANYMLACGIVWQKTADPEAGLELLEGLKSPDVDIRMLAQAFLVEGADASMGLLEDALSDGAVSPEAAGVCMVEILRKRQSKETNLEPSAALRSDSWLC